MNPCRTCLAFAPHSDDPARGACCALAPRPMVTPENLAALGPLVVLWPQMPADGPGSGCAQWRPQPLVQGRTNRLALALHDLAVACRKASQDSGLRLSLGTALAQAEALLKEPT